MKWMLLVMLPFLLAACDEPGERKVYPGYMEAKLVLVGPEEGGRIDALNVHEGGRVEKGDLLFRLEARTQEASLAAAKGRLEEAQAALKLSRLSLDRAKDLHERGVAAQARLDDAQTAYERNAAAQDSAKAAVREAQAMLDRRRVFAPASGSVEDVYFRSGEVANAGQPVVAVLPPANLRVRFYVQEAARAKLAKGETIAITCDGCPSGLQGRISFIARDAEFTPPVIFSREERGKLVYLVEAEPSGDAAGLTAGQPVTVTLGDGKEIAAR